MAITGAIGVAVLLVMLPVTPTVALLCVVLGFIAVFQSILQPAMPTLLSLNTESDR